MWSICWEHDEDYVPVPAVFLALLEKLARQRNEQARNARTLAALPPPAGTGQSERSGQMDRATWDREVAIGRARGRKRFALVDEWRRTTGAPKHGAVPEAVWRGLDDPTAEDVAAALREMSVSDDRAAMPPTPTPMLTPRMSAPEWPGAKGG